jgi:hypothetical protein
MSRVTTRRSQLQIWRWPALIAALTLFGLLAALLGHGGIWWGLSWAALAVPLIVALYFTLAGRRVLPGK